MIFASACELNLALPRQLFKSLNYISVTAVIKHLSEYAIDVYHDSNVGILAKDFQQRPI